MVVLLQDVLGLVDEDRGALQALPAVGNLLGQLPQLHHLSGGAEGDRAAQELERHRGNLILSQEQFTNKTL